jgi:hypothetical protein
VVVTDLDGTVRSRRLGVTEGVRAAVRAAQARGIRVCVATGRMWRSAAPWVRLLGADTPVILYNGGQVLDFATGRLLHERRLARTAARHALAIVREDPGVQAHLYLGDRVYVDRVHPLTEAYAADDGLSYEVVPALEPLLEEDPHKLLIIGSAARIEALGAAVRAAGVAAHAVQSEPIYLEILPQGVSKGAALRELARGLDVPLAEIVAVGDNWNDVEMLEAAGLGVAMGHAPAGVRARAGLVCATADDEGFREVIERVVLAQA